jgi:uncharacterized membrane protein YqjE
MDPPVSSAFPGWLASGRAALGLLVEMGCTRAQLASCELEEEAGRLAQLGLMALAALFLLSMLLLLSAFWLVLVFWDGPQVLVLSLVMLSYFLATLALVWRCRHIVRHRPPLLASTLAALRADRDALLGPVQSAP